MRDAKQRHIVAEFEERLKGRVGRVRFTRVAARPDGESLKLGHGLGGVFPSWVEDSPESLFPRSADLSVIEASCEFDRYEARYFAQRSNSQT